MYDIFIDSLLRMITLPSLAFADDFKLIVDVVTYSANAVQSEIDAIATWALEHGTPLSVEKCSVMHCGSRQPRNRYHINLSPLASVDSQRDLGVTRSPDLKCTAHCNDVTVRATRMCGVLRHVFRSANRALLWPAFTSYVLPILDYCAPTWNPYLKRDIAAIENVQRRFTKRIRGLEDEQYAARLNTLGALSLQDRRTFADMVTTYKALHGFLNCTAADVGLFISESSTRGGGLRLVQLRAANMASSNLFPIRAASNWNKLPLSIVSSASLATFKRLLLKHLSSSPV